MTSTQVNRHLFIYLSHQTLYKKDPDPISPPKTPPSLPKAESNPLIRFQPFHLCHHTHISIALPPAFA